MHHTVCTNDVSNFTVHLRRKVLLICSDVLSPAIDNHQQNRYSGLIAGDARSNIWQGVEK